MAVNLTLFCSSRHRYQRGVNLIELLIGMAVGLFVVGSAIALFSKNSAIQADNLKLARLNQDLRAMMDIMVRDIRRAGFVTSDPSSNNTAVITNPFFDDSTSGATTDLAVFKNDFTTAVTAAVNSATPTSANQGVCAVYSYNRDDDSPVAVDNNERLGFRLNGTALQMRRFGATNENCNVNAEWETITDPEVEITTLTFTLAESTLNPTRWETDTDSDSCVDGEDSAPNNAAVPADPTTATDCNKDCDAGEPCNQCVSGEACLYIRSIDISLTGRLTDDNSISQTITQDVRIRNDKFVQILP